jgi:tRNA 5-methylaminomethyl-2-thiouridine biosynthesis bifunctional protein
VHIAGNPVRNEKIARTLTHAGIPAIVVREISAPEAKELSGTEVAAGGWFYERGGWVDPGALCAVQSSGPEIVRTLGRSVETIQRGDHGWRLLDLQGHLLAETEHVLVCNAHDALRFEQSRHLPIRAVRGQLTYMEEKPGLLRTVCGDGYVTPARGGMHCVGATYNEGLVEPALRDEDHADNLRRLRRILPDVFPPESSAPSGGRVSFRTMSVDLLPVCGELAPGLHALLALGSRGISLAPLLAELLASDLCDEPSPLPRSLTEAMHPRRFAAVG